MNAVLVSTLAVTTLTAAVLLMLPAMSRTTVPLGVLVPRSRANDPAVLSAVRRFRAGVVVSFVVALLAAALVAPLGRAAPALCAVFLLLGGSVLAYLLARRGIQRAKREGGWLVDVPVRITGSVTPDAQTRPRPAAGWYAASLVALVVAAGVGIALYDSLPATIAVHWDSAGSPDRFAEKTVPAVFGQLLIGLGVLAVIFGISLIVRAVPWRRGSGERPEVAERIAALQAESTQSLLGWIAFVVTAAIGVLSMIGWLHAGSSEPSAWMAIATAGLVVVIFVVIAAYALRLTSGTRAARAAVPVAHGAAATTGETTSASATVGARGDVVDPRDDDRHWKGGLVYVNPGDPALFVPKRFGVGVTLNFGHPGGIAIGVVTLLLVAAAVVLPTLLR